MIFRDIWCQERKSGYFRSLQLQFHSYLNAKDRQILWMKKMDKILTYENRKMSMASMRSSITWIIMPRQNSNIFTFQLIFKSKFYSREERFRDGFLREKCILSSIAQWITPRKKSFFNEVLMSILLWTTDDEWSYT